MPFISQKDNRQRMQTYTPAEYIEIPDFSEVFNASVGLAIDEGLSISGYLNNELYRERTYRVNVLREEGFDVQKYRDRKGRMDYDRLSRDTNNYIETDSVLREKRNEKLRQRREYAEDVIERGSGYAQFFGMATGFMLDPINIATLPIATAGVSAKGLGVLASAMNVAGREAALATAAELAIQPLVYSHKLDIESPYSTEEALMAIGGAAVGGALLGGVAGGLSGYFTKVSQKSREILDPEIDSPESMAINTLERVAEDIDAFREATIGARKTQVEIEESFIVDLKTELLGVAGNKLKRGEVKKLLSEQKELREKLKAVKVDVEAAPKAKDVPAREAKKLAIRAAEDLAEQERQIFRDRLSIIDNRLSANDMATKAEGNLSRLEQGIIPDEYKQRLDDVVSETFKKSVEDDVKLFAQYESKMQQFNAPSRVSENYVSEQPQKPAKATVTERERDILERNGLAEDYDAAIQAFRNVDNPQLFIDGEFIDANDFMKQLDDEIEGINSVLECTLG